MTVVIRRAPMRDVLCTAEDLCEELKTINFCIQTS